MPAKIKPRSFPPPWTVDETDACFIVRDRALQALAYVYFEEEPGRRAAANLLTREPTLTDPRRRTPTFNPMCKIAQFPPFLRCSFSCLICDRRTGDV
jgi:hypothetical protein